jgi:phosphomannomutase
MITICINLDIKRNSQRNTKYYILKEFNEFLLQLDNSKVPHRVRIALLLLEFNHESIKKLMEYIKKIKKQFAKDNKLHDCSIYTDSMNGLGVTFMTCQDKKELSFKTASILQLQTASIKFKYMDGIWRYVNR